MSTGWAIGITAICIALAFWGWCIIRSGDDRWKMPTCFGSNPGPQERAENDCFHCQWNDVCLKGPARFDRK